jgi:branched-chain amino acid transport system ATP-binding protein
MLEVENLHVSYGRFEVLRGVSLRVNQDETISVIGANGAGKSTLVQSITGFLQPREGKIIYNGTDVKGYAPEKLVAMGIIQIFEGRRLFSRLNVIDNLLLGSYCHQRKNEKKRIEEDLKYIFHLFPILEERRDQVSGSLSGGEQQMLAIGRALMSRPKFLILDEPSLGLAPKVVKEIFQVIERLHKDGIPILLIEQNVNAALQISQRGYVLENGRVVIEGTKEMLLENKEISQAYLGR